MEFDLDTARRIIMTRLPLRSRWLVRDVPLDYDFTLAHRGHPALPTHTHAKVEWPGFWAFGEYDYAQCGGLNPRLGVRQRDGAICGLDVEKEESFFLLNASLDQFIRSFDFLESCLMSDNCFPVSATERLCEIDPQTYPKSSWKLLVEHLM